MPLKDSKTGCMGVAMGFSWVRCWDFLLKREHCYHWEVSLPQATCPVIETSSRARACCGEGTWCICSPLPGAPGSSLLPPLLPETNLFFQHCQPLPGLVAPRRGEGVLGPSPRAHSLLPPMPSPLATSMEGAGRCPTSAKWPLKASVRGCCQRAVLESGPRPGLSDLCARTRGPGPSCSR